MNSANESGGAVVNDEDLKSSASSMKQAYSLTMVVMKNLMLGMRKRIRKELLRMNTSMYN